MEQLYYVNLTFNFGCVECIVGLIEKEVLLLENCNKEDLQCGNCSYNEPCILCIGVFSIQLSRAPENSQCELNASFVHRILKKLINSA